jgi:hypothetical protein
LQSLPIFDAGSDEARDILNRPPGELAEAADTIRAHDILHRSEYKPLAAVREDGRLRVYFEILDCAPLG